MSISRKREAEIRAMNTPPNDPAEEMYWHYHKRMHRHINALDGTDKSWAEIEEETQELMDRALERIKNKH